MGIIKNKNDDDGDDVDVDDDNDDENKIKNNAFFELEKLFNVPAQGKNERFEIENFILNKWCQTTALLYHPVHAR